MEADKEMLGKMLTATGPDAAYFYLCGPTEPTADVYKALVAALKTTGKSQEDAEAFMEEVSLTLLHTLDGSLTRGRSSRKTSATFSRSTSRCYASRILFPRR